MESDVGDGVKAHPVRHNEGFVDLGIYRLFVSTGVFSCAGKNGVRKGEEGIWRTDRIPQYMILISTSSGALHTLSAFLILNKRGESVMSAREPKRNVRVARDSPIIVRYWKCQP